MSTSYIDHIANTLQLPKNAIHATLLLIDEGATIPFIARYRKDKTGGLDEVQVANVLDAYNAHKEFEARKSYILKTLAEKLLLTPALTTAVNQATTLAILEDIYAPYKSRRKTRADTARELGLEPLAHILSKQTPVDVDREASRFITKDVKDAQAALQGARDIIAERIGDDVDLKASLRQLFANSASLYSKVVKTKMADAAKYKDYFDYNEKVKKIPNHRFMAISRGVQEGFLRSSIEVEPALALDRIERKYIRNNTPAAEQVYFAIEDAYKRLIQPSLETELRTELKTRADKDAIDVFAKNLKSLLLASPLGEKNVLAIDPGYRTGCKVVVLNHQGALLDTDVIFIHDAHRLSAAAATINGLVGQYSIEAIAVGDGTAGRETEKFIKDLTLGLPVYLVNEDGASIYSASEIAREEFPELDLTYRGAVSIGRRLMDPLAELVKIDPKSIGVGQYQHDVNQSRLKEKLDQTVEICVNNVGVNVNTASKYLLAYVSGIGPVLADNIIKYRTENGSFKNRRQLLKVSRLGEKVYEQAAGFLRIKDGDNVLDATGVHPESYPLVSQIAKSLHLPLHELMGHKALETLRASDFVNDSFGIHTVQDVIAELKKPGQDPRSSTEHFEFSQVYTIEDLHDGMVLPGLVTNLTNFGAFVNIGIKQDGMVHISEIADNFIKDPAEILTVGQKVMVKVIQIDQARQRVQLSIKKAKE